MVKGQVFTMKLCSEWCVTYVHIAFSHRPIKLADIDEAITRKLLNFADDIKIYQTVRAYFNGG